ncbi:MAG: UDP-N-acetylmuramate dehydrogenase [Candidatus Kerfeldbacteria bacterium]|nr:UDP-N-acetylmuramate dehydrogenase [Candidatus Kerfeldbacteria bacterium]
MTADVLVELQNNLGKSLKVNEPLSRHTNFKIGGPAKYFFTAKTTEELVHAIQVADELKLPLLILGGGSNVLVSDNGFAGLAVMVKNGKYSIKGQVVTAEAGVSLGFLVQKVAAAGLTGFEPLVAVPGTVGGAIFGNAGIPQVAKGFIGDWVKEVVVCRGDTIVHVPGEQCGFGYRTSIFKQSGNDIILSAVFALEPGDKVKSQELIKKYIAVRKTQPYHLPSSGCIFTNLPVTDPSELRQKFPGQPRLEEFLKRGQLPSSWLIDQAGLKGKTMGQIQVSEQHANYLVNLGSGRAEEVIMLISYIKQQVRDKFGIQLQEEVRYIGF